jgi:hypothetical protein
MSERSERIKWLSGRIDRVDAHGGAMRSEAAA